MVNPHLVEAAITGHGYELEPDTYGAPVHGWCCFHCGENFRSPNAARLHFGADPGRAPGCVLRLKGGDLGLLAKVRELEAEIERWRNEDTDLHRAIASQQADHATALQREEEKGYARGLRDAEWKTP